MKQLLFIFAMMLIGMTTVMAQRTVTGTITDENGDPLPFANVYVEGTTSGTTTDIDGNYTLTVPEGGTTLVVSFTGYDDQKLTIGDSNSLNFTMAEGVTFEEIVVVGYSEVQRRKLISAVSNVGAEKLENIPLTDVNQMLQGNAAGVFTTANSGQPGAAQQVRIRGTGSITAGRNPLYVIDGIIIEQGDFSELASTENAPDVLSQLNPNDIESLTILKDASATALYGARGSNGVVVITTKKGEAGDTKVTLKSQYGQTQPSFGNFKLMTAEQQWNYERDILTNSGADQATLDGARPESLLDETTDWFDNAFQGGQTYNMELQASGGSDKTQFFLSGGYFDQQGTLYLSDFNRLSLRSNINHKANDRLSIGVNLNGSYSQQNNAVNGSRFQSPLAQAYTTTPMQSPYQADGTLYTGLEDDWGAAVIGDNFLYSLPLNTSDINTFRLISKVSGEYKILQNLKFSQAVNVDLINADEEDYDDLTTNDGVNDGGNLSNGFVNSKTVTSQSLLRFFDDFGSNSDHSINALVGYEYQRSKLDKFVAAGKGFASGELQTLNSAAEPNFVEGSETNYSFLSYLGEIIYGYQNKYQIKFTGRRDGSSRFGANNRWANFWSVGASWSIADENFLANSRVINDLKLRVSYGTSGNADIGNFDSRELYGFGNAYLGNPGSSPSQIGNPDLTWELSNSLNVGLDFGIFDNKIGGSVEYYIRNSRDILLDVPVSSTSGFTDATQNLGEIQNSGVEVTLNLNPIIPQSNDGFSWSSDFNIAFNDNKVVSLPDGEDILNGRQIYREGYPIRSFYAQEWAGVNPADGTPLWFSGDDDENRTGVTGTYSNAGRFIVGNAEPDFTAGWTNTFRFKGVTLSAFLYTAQGHELYNSTRRFIDSDGLRFGWAHSEDALDHWKEPGDISSRPQPLSGGNNNGGANSTRYLEDASYVRLRNASLGYTLPKTVADKLKIGGINVYVQGTNLWTYTKYSGIDPEADEDGDEFFRYPVGKSWTVGFDITF